MVSIFAENWHAEYLEDSDSYNDIGFLNLKPKIHFGQIWAEKVEVVCFA